MITQTSLISALIARGGMTERQFFAEEIRRWKASEVRKNQLAGERYYRGKHDILDRKRTVIGADGKLVEVKNLPNNQIIDNQYGKMVDQKTNYLLGNPFKMQTDREEYKTALAEVFDRTFKRTLQNIGEGALNGGIGWLYVYYDAEGSLAFKRFISHEIRPFWKDDEHTELDVCVRVYEQEVYDGQANKTIERVEIYKVDGVERYILEDGVLVDDPDYPSTPYMTRLVEGAEAEAYNWGRVPIVAFKCNDKEIPLICKTKPLQDAINATLSDFQNNMQEDSRNTILVIKNYDGENLGEFRHNLAAYGAVKVRSEEGANGGVDALRVEVNAENYKSILEILKKALIENAMGFDAKDLRSSTPNQMNIQSMYSDVDLDANGMETEFQASFEQLLWFVNVYLANSGKGNFDGTDIEIVFDRDMLMNEGDIIDNVRNSMGVLSKETLLAHHPWVSDTVMEMDRLVKEHRAELEADPYRAAFEQNQATAEAGPGGADDENT